MRTRNDPVLDLRLNAADPAPAYVQIAAGIRVLVQSRELAPGRLLPPERILCRRYGVSRMTLRQAYGVLEQEHLIERRRGHGTFVSAVRMHKQEQEMRSFTEEITARGAVPSSRLLVFRQSEPDAAAREFFSLPAGQPVYHLERLRFSNEQPVALETVEIPCFLCPRLDRFNLATQSLYRLFEEEYGLRLSHCVEEISAAKPTRSEQKALGVVGSAAVLVVRRKTFTDQDTPVELGRTTYRGDLYTAIVRSVRAR